MNSVPCFHSTALLILVFTARVVSNAAFCLPDTVERII